MRYLIDTSSLSRAIREDASELRRIVWHLGIDQIAVSVLTRLEIEYGLHRRRVARAAAIRDFVAQFPSIDFDQADAGAAGALRARLEVAGRPIGLIDTMLAAQALLRDLTLITHNTREFARIRDLTVVSL